MADLWVVVATVAFYMPACVLLFVVAKTWGRWRRRRRLLLRPGRSGGLGGRRESGLTSPGAGQVLTFAMLRLLA